MMIKNQKQKINSYLLDSGQAVLIAVIFFMIISITVIFGFAVPIVSQARIASDLIKSHQGFFLAEAGLEDVAYRITQGHEVVSPEVLTLDGNSATTLIEGGPSVKTLTAEGDYQSRFRKIKTDLLIAEGASFHYGVQVGDGGLVMNNNSTVNGNVFVTGNIDAANNAKIFGTALVATPSKIDGGRVHNGDVYADSCTGGTQLIGPAQTLHTYDKGNCSGYEFLTTDGLPVASLPLPISNEQIDQWKNQAESAGIIDGDYILANGLSGSLGPTKITGKLIINNNATLTVTGTLWVVGEVTIKNGATVRLDPGYGTLSGMIISDNTILLDNGSTSEGSGEEGSYLMYLSTSASSQAIEVKNNADAAIVYTSNGTIKISNNAHLVEVVGYKVNLQNNAIISYEIGLESVVFTNGPGGGWTMINWREIE
jgi:hypothetical protein